MSKTNDDKSPPSSESLTVPRAEGRGRQFLTLSLTALGVVYGDIGTSPLYALRECFHGTHSVTPSPANVLGILSLVFWALTLVISIKYLLFLMRAGNRGEGGILALLALLTPLSLLSPVQRRYLLPLGLFGAALLYGDGAITPAISVLSAVEGLKVAAPALEGFVVPVTILILILLFLIQRRGTTVVGTLFGPVMAIWFSTIAMLGIGGILKAPEVFFAVNPLHGARFFMENGQFAFRTLGSVFLVVTGGEALYADMGHFGPRPIRWAWFTFVLPALLLNYFGQGALLLVRPGESTEPFFHLAPGWALYPLVILATLATVIASQAVISGAFSLTRQAMQLGYSPRFRLVQTSSEEIGQVYIPTVNWGLMLITLALVVGFGSSASLAGAYGVAVTTTMVITTILAFFLMVKHWHWQATAACTLAGLFLSIDIPFFGANLLKIAHGGWFPLVAGIAVFTLMATWRRGRAVLSQRLQGGKEPLEEFIDKLTAAPPHRVPGTAVFMTGSPTGTPPVLHHHLAHNQVLHEQVIILTVLTEEVPRVPASDRVTVTAMPLGFARVIVRYGFMQSPNVPVALRQCDPLGLSVALEHTTYYLARETIISTPQQSGMMRWQEKLFSFMSRNSVTATSFYNIPAEQVVELGQQVEI
ncbi:potassium transporter Kup [Geobacter argillaceus]|jgi:KUP system potassium uptake protein|uniref:Probable potassium transport system protein Kup n=1 Tax=Geobacter argillaceus TaxID=345631 RepID=A0A562VFG5_9BACT|nr:potassium transporter Kup [Geobacter argillaceus]TWJ16544.1 KUP system potassium uptake protein [Geobacter argillaceus]